MMSEGIMAEDKGFKRLTLNVDEQAMVVLRQYAEDASMITTSGVTAGMGSISALLRAIGDGRFVIVPADDAEVPEGKVVKTARVEPEG